MRTPTPDGIMFSYSLTEAPHPFASTLQSTAIHALLISGAIWGTKTVVVDRPTPDPIAITEWVAPTQTRSHVYHLGAEFPAPPRPSVPVFPDHDLSPVFVPHGIPQVDPRTMVSPLPCIDRCPGDQPVGSSAAAWSEAAVDELPTLISAGPLRYPTVLMGVGVEGRVTLAFVIDSVGRVEPEGITVLSATHAGFISAAREAVAASLYEPARKDGHAVRVKVQQTVTFKK